MLNLDECTWPTLLFQVLVKVNKTVIKNTIAVGAWDFIGLNREKMLFDHDICLKLTKKEVDWVVNNLDLNKFNALLEVFDKILEGEIGKNRAISTKNRKNIIKGLHYAIVNPPFNCKYNSIRRIVSLEKSYLGVPISYHKVDEASKEIADTTIEEFIDGKSGTMKMIVEINKVKEYIPKKSGKNMAFLTIEDTSGQTDAVVFNELWEKQKNILFEGNTILIIGKRSDRNSLLVLNCKSV